MKTHRHVQEQLESLFARCPDLCGFAIRAEAEELFVSDIGISPRLSAEQYGEIYQEIAETLGDLAGAGTPRRRVAARPHFRENPALRVRL